MFKNWESSLSKAIKEADYDSFQEIFCNAIQKTKQVLILIL